MCLDLCIPLSIGHPRRPGRRVRGASTSTTVTPITPLKRLFSTFVVSGDSNLLTFTTAANRTIQVGTAASGNGYNLDIEAGNGFDSNGGGALNLHAGKATWGGRKLQFF